MGWRTKSPRIHLLFLDCRGLNNFVFIWKFVQCLPASLFTSITYSHRVGSDIEDSPIKKAKANGIELNARGIPARKRKKNSLIYGADDLVSISFNVTPFKLSHNPFFYKNWQNHISHCLR